jgi:hypothetical protein
MVIHLGSLKIFNILEHLPQHASQAVHCYLPCSRNHSVGSRFVCRANFVIWCSDELLCSSQLLLAERLEPKDECQWHRTHQGHGGRGRTLFSDPDSMDPLFPQIHGGSCRCAIVGRDRAMA